MICILLGLLQHGSSPIKVVELIEPGSKIVVAQATLLTRDYGDYDQAAARVIAESLLEGTTEFTKHELLSYGAQAGIVPRVEVMDDLIRITIAAPRKGLSVAVALIESMLVRPKLEFSALQARAVQLEKLHRSAWMSALVPVLLPYSKLRRSDFDNVRLRLLRPENVVIALGGDFAPGRGIEQVKTQFGVWAPAPKKFVGKPTAPPLTLDNREPVATCELAGEIVRGDRESDAGTILAVFALGVGKQSTLFRVLREQLRQSYRQEALLWATSHGWVPRIVAAVPPELGRDFVEVLRGELLKDIEAWDETTLECAKALSESALQADLSVSPIWVDSTGPATTELRSRVSWLSFVTVANTPRLARDGILSQKLQEVTLESLKNSAREWISKAKPRWID